MQTEEEIASSSTMMDPWSIFLYGMKAPMTREKYIGRVAKFFDFIGMTEGTMEERAKAFTERGRGQPDWVFLSVLRFAQAQKERVSNGNLPKEANYHFDKIRNIRNKVAHTEKQLAEDEIESFTLATNRFKSYLENITNLKTTS
jgi:hypothetical protein